MTLKTSLGIWALGPMITRFVPVGYQPQWTSENIVDKVKRAVAGLGDLIDDYEFHYPWELNPDNLDVNGNVLHEQIWVDYLLTGGKVKNDVIILFDSRTGRLPSTVDDLHAPQAAGDYQLWAVVRDDRGGATWLTVPLHAR